MSTSQGPTWILVTRLLFRMKDGSIDRDFHWVGMPDTQHHRLNDALAGVFPGLSQAHEEMLAS